jgi:acyl carrier protein
MATIDEVLSVLSDTLQLGERVQSFKAATPLFGSLPELDSMAVVTVITALEDRFGFVVDDDEINAETFATVGNLCAFVDDKLTA